MPRRNATPPSAGSAPPGTATRISDFAVLKAHELACRWDLVPQEFGKEAPVDEADPAAVKAEWLRQLRLWVDYNPEEMFALKIGAIVLVLALAGLWIGIAALG